MFLENKDMTYPVRRRCPYCNLDMGKANFTWDKPNMTTDGICPDCAKKETEKFQNGK